MKTRTLLFSLLTTCICCTHSDKGDIVDKDRLTGRYVYQENYQDTIDLNSDGTYSNYTWADGKKLKNSGTWEYDSLEGRVIFNNFSFLLDSNGHGLWRSRIKTEDNEIRLVYAREIYKAYFLRVDSLDRRGQ